MRLATTKVQLPKKTPAFLGTHVLGAYQFKNPAGGNPISFLLVSKDREPRLRGFVGESEGYFFISDEVPEEYRPYFVYHEHLEFTAFKGEMGRCLAALKCELGLVPEYLQTEYLVYRRDFFEHLLTFLRLPENDTPAEFLAEIQASFDYLNE